MNNKRNFFKLTGKIIHKTIFIGLYVLLAVTFVVHSNTYQFDTMTHLNSSLSNSSQWLQLINHPTKEQEYFIINKAGKMYHVDNDQQHNLVLDLNAEHENNSSAFVVTAITLHPNFSLKDQPGYGIFYTAHLEVLDKKNRTKRIQERSSEIKLKFDAVITEWKFRSTNEVMVDLSTKREVLRIAVPENYMVIRQMSFSPHIKSWNEGFGLLYVVLNGEKKWQKPLYSGVILRINPTKFGLRSYTVPVSNPYLQHSDIKDEIYLLGGENINKLIWPDKSNDDLLLSHQYQNKFLLSLSSGQDDWRENLPKDRLYQSDNEIEDILLYRGRNLPALRNKLLLVTKQNGTKTIESLNFSPSVDENISTTNIPQPIWRFTSQQVNHDSEIELSTDRDDEVLLLDKVKGSVFKISQAHAKPQDPIKQSIVEVESDVESFAKVYLILLALIVIGVVLYFYKKKQFSAKAIVRKQFANVELSESQMQIGLYHRHQKNIDTMLEVNDIISCDIKLNEQIITLINSMVGHGFDNEKEQALRDILVNEQVHKMIDGKVRQISLSFTDKHNKSYTVCLYIRKGSDRITKKPYLTVIDDVVNWCWLMAEKINPIETAKRKEKAIISSDAIDNSDTYQNKPPLHQQTSAIKADVLDYKEMTEAINVQNPIVSNVVNDEAVIANKPSDDTDHHYNQNSVDKSSLSPSSPQEKIIDTELVDALEKLVNLKQQGYLTEQEFIKAKENLLQNLLDS